MLKIFGVIRLIHTILDISRLNHHKYIDNDSIISDNFTYKERLTGDILLDSNWKFRK